MVRAPSSASTCFARARLLLGQKRVPLPPARITGANRGPVLPSAKPIVTNVSGKSSAHRAKLRGRRSGARSQPAASPLPQLPEAVAHPLDTLVHHVAGHRIRQANMFG